MGGPGETQLEADRRLLQDKIVKLERELEQVVRTRQLHRAKRRKVPHPIVALVGYTMLASPRCSTALLVQGFWLRTCCLPRWTRHCAA